MKFVDKEIQEDFDSIPPETKLKVLDKWIGKRRIMFVREWLKRKKLVAQITAGSAPVKRYAIKFEIKKGKTESTFIEINDDGEIDYKF